MAIANWHEVKLPWPVGPYIGRYSDNDPREALQRRLSKPGPDGWVMVKVSEVKDVYQMRVCRSTREFDRDEDGPTAPMTAHCVYEAGHQGRHSNGYYSWDGRDDGMTKEDG